MAKISGWVYLFVGLLVIIVSLIVDGLWFFLYVGLVFLVIGIAKLLIKYMMNKKPESKKMDLPRKSAFFCPNCGAQTRDFFNFCFHCGSKLK